MSTNDALKRFNRVVSILVQLQSKKIIRAQEMADRFEVSLRTIYRDIKTLEEAGIPIYSEAGIGYSIVEGYKLPPLMLNQEEAASIVAAETLMQKYTDKGIKDHFMNAMFKVKSVLRSQNKEWVDAITSQVIIQPGRYTPTDILPHALSAIFESIAKKTQVQLSYQAADAAKPVERIIETVGVLHQDSYWYIIAYCHLRKEYRQFRTDRIKQVTATSNPFTRKHQALETYIKPLPARPTTKVVIEVEPQVMTFLAWEKHYHGFSHEEQNGDKVIMHFNVHNLEDGFARWYLVFGDKAKIIEPISLKDTIKNLLRRQLEKVDQ